MATKSLGALIGKVWTGLLDSIKKFPVETALGLTYFILFILTDAIDEHFPEVDPTYILMWLLPNMLLTFSLGRIAKWKPSLRWVHILSYFLWIPLAAFLSKDLTWVMGISYILTGVLFLMGDRPLPEGSLARNIIHTVLRTALGLILGGVLSILILAIVGSVSFLFSLDLGDGFFVYPTAFVMMVVTPLLCFWAITGKDAPQTEGKRDTFIRVLVDYILSPAIILYTVILYAYCIRILVRWTLPDGGVGYMVTTFILLSLGTILLRELLGKKHFDWFFDNFTFISAGPLILLWTGTIRRIGDYGLTPSRFYLLVLAALMTLFVGMLLLRWREYKFQMMGVLVCLCCILFTFIPGISAEDLSSLNQRSRLRSSGEVISQSEILSMGAEQRQRILEEDGQLRRAVHRAKGAYAYLQMKSRGNHSLLEQYSFVPSLDLFDEMASPSSPSVHYSITMEGDIDLGQYTVLAGSDTYRVVNNSGQCIIKGQGERGKKEVLLECNVKQRLLEAPSLESGKYNSEELLVYRNGKYLAILKELSVNVDSDGKISFRLSPEDVLLLMKP